VRPDLRGRAELGRARPPASPVATRRGQLHRQVPGPLPVLDGHLGQRGRLRRPGGGQRRRADQAGPDAVRALRGRPVADLRRAAPLDRTGADRGTADSGRRPGAGRRAGPAPHQDAGPELRHRPEHRASARPHRGRGRRRRGGRGRPGPRVPHPRPARGGVPGGGRRDRPGAGRTAAEDRGGAAAGLRRPAGGAAAGRAGARLGARPAADRLRGEPALQRRGPGAAPPARAPAVAADRPGDGAGGGRRPAGGTARQPHVRDPLGEGRLVRRRAPGRLDRPDRSSGRPRTSTPGWSPSPAASRRPATGWPPSPSSTPPSPSAARRCAPPSPAGPARPPPPSSGCAPQASTRVRGGRSSASRTSPAWPPRP
jgi:hypothetical protein